MNRIDALTLRDPLLEAAQRGVPILGICLGMQLLFDRSEESPGARGLGLIPGDVLRFNGTVKIPHIGWNDVAPVRQSRLFPEARPGVYYFVHSFYVPENEMALALTTHGVTFSSAIGRDNIFGVQFHPEKSQAEGLNLLGNLLRVAVW